MQIHGVPLTNLKLKICVSYVVAPVHAYVDYVLQCHFPMNTYIRMLLIIQCVMYITIMIQHLGHLQTILATKQAELMPKKKFTFTARKKERDSQSGSNLPSKDQHNKVSIPLLIGSASVQCGFSNKEEENLSMQVCTYILTYCIL